MASRDRPRRISVIVWPPTLPARAPTTMAGGQSTQQIALAMMPRPHPDADRQWNSLTWPPLRSIRAASTSCEDEDSADNSKASQSARASANIRYTATVTLILVNFTSLPVGRCRLATPATRAEELSPWTVGRSRVRGIGHFGRLPGSEGPFRIVLATACGFLVLFGDANRLPREMPAGRPASGAPLDGCGWSIARAEICSPKGTTRRRRSGENSSAHPGEPRGRIEAIDGPAGCGKTTFTAQECALDVRPTAWVNLRDLDNDPVRLLTRLACARWVRSKFSIHDSLRVSRRRAQCKERQSCYWDCSARSLTGAPPVQLVLDDVHALHESASIEVLRSLVGECGRPRLVLVSRIEPDVSLARLRVVHDLTEVHFADLALHEHETAEVLDRAGAHWQESAVEELHSRTEGWVTGVALAAMASSEAGQRPPRSSSRASRTKWRTISSTRC